MSAYDGALSRAVEVRAAVARLRAVLAAGRAAGRRDVLAAARGARDAAEELVSDLGLCPAPVKGVDPPGLGDALAALMAAAWAAARAYREDDIAGWARTLGEMVGAADRLIATAAPDPDEAGRHACLRFIECANHTEVCREVRARWGGPRTVQGTEHAAKAFARRHGITLPKAKRGRPPKPGNPK